MATILEMVYRSLQVIVLNIGGAKGTRSRQKIHLILETQEARKEPCKFNINQAA